MGATTSHASAWTLVWASMGADEEASNRSRRLGVPSRLPVLMSQDGRLDLEMNDYFCSPQFQSFSLSTQETYAQEIAIWCAYLARVGLSWTEAVEDDFLAFKVARTGPSARPHPVAGATWNKSVAALTAMYGWAVRKQVVAASVVPPDMSSRRAGSGAKATNARRLRPDRWVTPATYRLWREVGLRGQTAQGVSLRHYAVGGVDSGFKGRLAQRNTAFSNLLFATGLRVRECGSLLTTEVPNGQQEQPLASAAAKFGRGRMFLWPQGAVDEVQDYVRLTRRAAVSRARKAGRYDHIRDILWVVEVRSTRRGAAVLVSGEDEPRLLDGLDADTRRRLFTDTDRGPEPLSLWLNENGMPLPHPSWDAVFAQANRRVGSELARLGYAGDRLWVMPHSLRFSFALTLLVALHQQIDAVGGTASHFGYDEERYRFAFEQVRDRLGHASIETTKGTYLRPVQTLRGHALLTRSSRSGGLEAALSDLAGAVFADGDAVSVRDLGAGTSGRDAPGMSHAADTFSDDR